MNFIKELQNTKYKLKGINNSELVEVDFERENFRLFEAIEISSNLWLSIQASYGHHCTPQLTMINLNDYSHWEIALLTEDGFVRVSDVLPNFSSLAEIEHYCDGSAYGYVPVDLVEELYLALK